MALTTWEFESKPGGTWFMGQAGITMGQNLYDGFIVKMGSLGDVTSWTLEDK